MEMLNVTGEDVVAKTTSFALPHVMKLNLNCLADVLKSKAIICQGSHTQSKRISPCMFCYPFIRGSRVYTVFCSSLSQAYLLIDLNNFTAEPPPLRHYLRHPISFACMRRFFWLRDTRSEFYWNCSSATTDRGHPHVQSSVIPNAHPGLAWQGVSVYFAIEAVRVELDLKHSVSLSEMLLTCGSSSAIRASVARRSRRQFACVSLTSSGTDRCVLQSDAGSHPHTLHAISADQARARSLLAS